MSFVGHTFAGLTSGPSITPSLPSGIVATDKLVAFVHRDAGSGISTSTPGWTAVAGPVGHPNAANFRVAIYLANGDAAAPTFDGGLFSAWKVTVAAFRGRGAGILTQIQHTDDTIVPAGPVTAVAGADGCALWSEFVGATLSSAPSGWIDIVNESQDDFQTRVAYTEALPGGTTGDLSRTAQDFTAKNTALILLNPSGVVEYFLGTDLYF